MNVQEAKQRLLALFGEDGGLRAKVVEADELLSQNRSVATLAAYELAAEPDIVSGEETDGRQWFRYSFLIRPKTDAV